MRIPTAAIGVLGAAALAACGSEPQAAEPPLPTFRQPPDKPAGPAPARVAGTATTFRLAPFAKGLDMPNQLVARPGDRRLFVVEQKGRVRVLSPNGTLRRTPYLDLRKTTRARGEQGLLSIAFTPDGRSLIAMYTNNAGDSRVVRYRAGAQRATRAGARTLLKLDQPYENHNGGTVLFDERGRLLVSFGDGGSAFDPQQRAQDLRSRFGKILRHERGRWSPVAFGLRNPWRMSFDDATGRLWIGDVGQDKVEEIDAIWPAEPGTPLPNLGWSAYEGHHPVGVKRLSREGKLTWPVASYSHAGGHCSVSGGQVYRGAEVRALRGRYVYGDFCRGTIWSLNADGAENRAKLDLRRETARLPGVVSFGADRRGELYAVSISGTVSRLVAAR